MAHACRHSEDIVAGCTHGPPGLEAVWAARGEHKVPRERRPATDTPGSELTTLWDGATARLKGARNEIVGFQIVLEAGEANVEGLTVTFDRLDGPDGAAITAAPTAGEGVFDWTQRDIELFLVRYLPIRGLSRLSYELYDERHIPERFRGPHDAYGIPTGTWADRPDHDMHYPDIAVPLEWSGEVSVAAEQSQAIWSDVYIPRDAAPGTYTGSVTVRHGDETVATLPVSLEVWDFALPDTPSAKTMLFYSSSNIARRYLGTAYPTDPADLLALRAVLDKHAQVAHRHKIALIDGQVPDDNRPPDAWIPWLDGSLFTAAHGYRGPWEGGGNGVFSVGTYRSWAYGWETTEESLQTRSDAWRAWFDDHFPDTEVFLYLIDESSDYAQTEQWASWVDGAPGGGLPTFATAPLYEAHSEAPSLDIGCGWAKGTGEPDGWLAGLAHFGEDPARRLFLYNGTRPWAGSFATEDSGVAFRVNAWGQHKLGVDRWFFWESTYYDNYQGGTGQTDVFSQAHTFGGTGVIDPTIGETGWNYSNGDGVLFYPGTDRVFPEQSYEQPGPIASLRLKGWRRGVQDGDYLALAERVDPAAVAALMAEHLPVFMHEYGVSSLADPTYVRTETLWSNDPDAWAAARDALAAIIATGSDDTLHPPAADVPTLQVTGGDAPALNDMSHAVQVNSTGRFQLGFEASRNYGLSQWFDLVNDPTAATDITHYTDDPAALTEQGSLCNQVIYPDDTHASHRTAEWQWPTLPRDLRVIEANPMRTVIETTAHPTVTSVADQDLTIVTRYTVYATGQIYVTATATSAAGRTDITEWRHCVLGVGDPSYRTTATSGADAVVVSPTELRAPSATWSVDAWAGHRVSLDGYREFDILSNTSDTLTLAASSQTLVGGAYSIGSRPDVYGWLRGVDHQHPYTWSADPKTVLFAHWDPATPAPWSDWTAASVMLAPAPGNPWSIDNTAMHHWDGFKRHHYRHVDPVLAPGVGITNHYLMQLGTAGDDVLPSITQRSVANARADDYRTPVVLEPSEGQVGSPAFDVATGAYRLIASGQRVDFAVDGDVTARHAPIFEVSGYTHAQLPAVAVRGHMDAQVHVRRHDADTVLVHVIEDLDRAVRLQIGPPGSVWGDTSVDGEVSGEADPSPEADSDAGSSDAGSSDAGVSDSGPLADDGPDSGGSGVGWVDDPSGPVVVLAPHSALPVPGGAPSLSATDHNAPPEGLNNLAHWLDLEVDGAFRIGFEASRNYGLTRWFDLAHDPTASRDLADNLVEPADLAEQGALFNQDWTGTGYFYQVHRSAQWAHPGVQRTLTVDELSPLRAVVTTVTTPTSNTDVMTEVEVTTRYVVYATGEVYVTATTEALDAVAGLSWTHGTLGVSDPQYTLRADSGDAAVVVSATELQVPGAGWGVDQWAGYQLEQPLYRQYTVISNTADTLTLASSSYPLTVGDWALASQNNALGWLRGVDHQLPYSWSADPKTSLVLTWDPATPAPFADWSRASVLITADPANPLQGDTPPLHGWDGFKRHSWRTSGVSLDAGAAVAQRYRVQLGTEAHPLLPDIDDLATVDALEEAYRGPAALSVGVGGAATAPFDTGLGCYPVAAVADVVEVTLDGAAQPVRFPVLAVSGYGAAADPLVTVTGVPSPVVHVQRPGDLVLVQLLAEVSGPVTIRVEPSP